MKKKIFLFIVLLFFLFFLLSCSKTSCIPEECISKSRIFCDKDKILNLTYACIDDECSAFSNKSFDCGSLNESMCFNSSVLSIKSYSCIDISCVGSAEIIVCDNKRCINGACDVNCGNNIIDEGENCKNCPDDVQCKEDELCINSICVPKDQEIKICAYDAECRDDNACTVDYCDGQKGKCFNQYLKNKVPSFCCGADYDCDEGNICTEDICKENKCIHERIVDCCSTHNDCSENQTCVENSCI